MNTENHTASPVDRAEAARLLAQAEGGAPVTTDRDRRVYAGFTAAVSLAMGLGTILMMLSSWAVIPYALVLLGLVWWQISARDASPRRANLIYTLGVVGSGVMIGFVVVALNVIRTTVGLTPGWYLLGAVVVAAPGLVAAALIARRGTR